MKHDKVMWWLLVVAVVCVFMAVCQVTANGQCSGPACGSQFPSGRNIRQHDDSSFAVARTNTIYPAVCRITCELPDGAYQGTGTLVWANPDADEAWVLTSWHLSRGVKPDRIKVTFANGEGFFARIAGTNQVWDALMLAIRKPERIKPMPVAFERPKVGEQVWSAGYGRGTFAAIPGRVSQFTAPTQAGTAFDFVQITGAGRQGDSGGPIINSRGCVIGVQWGGTAAYRQAVLCTRIRNFWRRVGYRLTYPLAPRIPIQPPGVLIGSRPLVPVYPQPTWPSQPPAPEPPADIDIPTPEVPPEVEQPACPTMSDIESLKIRMATLETQLAEIERTPGPPGKDGRDGLDGKDGKDADWKEVEQGMTELFASLQGQIKDARDAAADAQRLATQPIDVQVIKGDTILDRKDVRLGDSLKLNLIPVTEAQ